MNNTFSIKGQVAIVTGGGGVLGGSIAKHLITAGCKVVVLDIRAENVNDRVEELKQMGGSFPEQAVFRDPIYRSKS